jgi:hypothetical protein
MNDIRTDRSIAMCRSVPAKRRDRLAQISKHHINALTRKIADSLCRRAARPRS